MKTIVIFLLAGATLAAGGAAEPVDRSTANAVLLTPSFINQLAEEMRTNHPALKAVRARADAAEAGVAAVRVWEDPMFRLGGMAAETEMRMEDGDFIYGIEQRLPLFGRPRMARRVAEAELAVANFDTDYQFQLLRVELARSLLKAALAERTTEIGQQDLPWLEAMISVAEQRYRTGSGSQTDVLRLENERAKRANLLVTARRDLEHEQVVLNRLLARELHASWPRIELPSPADPVAYSRRLVELAVKYEPKLKRLRQETRRAEATLALTRRQRFPDVSIGLEGRNYTGDGSFRQGAVMLGFSIPWGNARKYRGDIQREEARLKAAGLDLSDYEFSVREEVHHLTVRIDAARREALLYRDEIIPRSALALESARAGWETGRVILTEALEARRMLLDAQLMYARAVAEQYQMMAELVLCCGLGDLEALKMIGAGVDTDTVPKDE